MTHLRTAQGAACNTKRAPKHAAMAIRAVQVDCWSCIGTYEWKGRAAPALIKRRRDQGHRIAGD